MTARPSTSPSWASTGGTRLEPSAGQKAAGFAVDDRPPARWVNFLWGILSDWKDYFGERILNGATDDDVELTAIAKTGTDVDGGKMTLSSGGSTGDGGSEIDFEVPLSGQGAGATARPPTVEMTLRETGALNLNPKTEANRPATGDSQAGDIAIIEEKLEGFNGTDWERYIPQAHVATAESSEITNTTSETPFDEDYTIPADTLKDGSTVRVRASLKVLQYSSGDLTLYTHFNGGNGIVGVLTPVTGEDIVVDCTFVVRDADSVGNLRAFGQMLASSSGVIGVNSGRTGTLPDMTAAQLVTLAAEWGVASTSNRIVLAHLVVDVV